MLTHEYPPYPGGVGRYCAELLAAAEAGGVDLHVLAPTFSSHGEAEHHDRITRFPGGVFRPRGLFAAVSAINKIVREKSFDRIHVADWPMLIALHWSIAPKSIPVSMTFHGTDALILGRSKFLRLLGAKRAAKRIDTAFANSAFTLDLVRSAFPEGLGNRQEVTPLGVGSHWFEPTLPAWREAARSLAGAQDGDEIILTVARLDRRKGHAKALRAIGQIERAKRSRLRYLAIGGEVDKGYKAELEALARELKVNAVFAGRQPDDVVRGAYGAASVFLLPAEPDPTRIEGFGLVFLEAGAQGLPSIGCRVHAIPEVIAEGTTGWLCDPDDLCDIAAKIEGAITLSRDSSARIACIEHVRQYTWARCAAQTYTS
ncbi:glycosyltransferase family 4 protein [Niveibacterium umoris]|nr:glycosyltransferase family 4 protein [Niveibacterium umoris]